MMRWFAAACGATLAIMLAISVSAYKSVDPVGDIQDTGGEWPLTSSCADPADAASGINLCNNTCVNWEAAPAGTDENICLDANENFVFSGPIVSSAADPADSGEIRLGNAETIAWEASPAGTDLTLNVNSSENLVYTGGSIYCATGVLTAAAGQLGWSGRALARSPAVGQYALGNNDHTAGATLDVDDAADTVIVKDLAGTGVGNLALLAGGKLIVDSDADSNNYVHGTDTLMRFAVEGADQFRLNSLGALMLDGKYVAYGSDTDFWGVYANGVGWSLNHTNCDGVGTDCPVISSAEGADDIDFTGDHHSYGTMYADSQQTVTISIAATPVQVTTLSAGSNLRGVSVASSEMTVTNAGIYHISASVSSNKASGAVARTTKGYIYLDDGSPAELDSECRYWRSLSATNDVGNANISCQVSLAASDKIELWVENTGGTEDIEIQHASVTVSKL